MTSNKNTARIGQLLAPNEQHMVGPQGPVVTPVLQHPVTPAITQPQMAPYQATYRSANANAGQQLEVAWGLLPPPPLPFYQP